MGLEGISALIFLSPCIISSFCRFIDQLNYALVYRHAKIVLSCTVIEFSRELNYYSLFFSIIAFSGVKMINQLLAGVHIASGAEAMALGARLGLNTRMLFDFVKNSGGTSWFVSWKMHCSFSSFSFTELYLIIFVIVLAFNTNFI